jgi:twitching motility protein PilT
MNDIKNLIKMLLEYATEHGADLHICPKSAPFVRLGGKSGGLKPVTDFETWALDVATVKTLISEILTPEQKAELQKTKYLNFTYTYGELGRFRAYAYTQRGTHALTIHTLPFEVPKITEMGLTDSSIRALEIITNENKGLIVVAGDYFSEKSVLLAALVNLINKVRKCHISTIENPIEYLHVHKNSIVVQKEIGTDVADFATALQQIKHENPDVIMISELRQDDLLLVMELAEERLVLTSIRTNQQQNDNPITPNILTALETMAFCEAEKRELPAPLIPNPFITVLHQQEDDIDIVDNFEDIESN